MKKTHRPSASDGAIDRILLFDEMSPGKLPCFYPSPDMCLAEDLQPAAFSIDRLPPRIRKFKAIEGLRLGPTDIVDEAAKMRTEAALRREISSDAEALFEAGMRTVIVSAYPHAVIGCEGRHAMVMWFFVSAYADEVQLVGNQHEPGKLPSDSVGGR